MYLYLQLRRSLNLSIMKRYPFISKLAYPPNLWIISGISHLKINAKMIDIVDVASLAE